MFSKHKLHPLIVASERFFILFTTFCKIANCTPGILYEETKNNPKVTGQDYKEDGLTILTQTPLKIVLFGIRHNYKRYRDTEIFCRYPIVNMPFKLCLAHKLLQTMLRQLSVFSSVRHI